MSNDNTESHVDVSLGLATTEQIFDEIARRFETVLLVTDGAAHGQSGTACGMADIQLHGNPFTVIGMARWAGEEILRKVMDQTGGL